MTKSVRILNSNSDVLDEILQSSKNVGNVQGLGYDYQGGMDKWKGLAMNFIPPKGQLKQHMSNQMSQHQQGCQKVYSWSKTQKWKCNHYGKFCHIKPYCYKLHGYLKPASQLRRKQTMVKPKKRCIPKNGMLDLIAHTSLIASAKED